MPRPSRDSLRRIRSLRSRIEALSSLRSLVALPAAYDITERQWKVVEAQLQVVEARLSDRLKRAARQYLPQLHSSSGVRALNALLGELELELARAYAFFDTYVDVLTQRHTPELGRHLAGCDVLAWDSLRRDHAALSIIEPPLVYCDRGFGASTLREGVLLPNAIPNPMPLIQIPYSRLKEKYNLTSVLHETGHEAMVRLGLVRTLPPALREALARAGASRVIQDLFGLWTSEMAPDFWTFCACGFAQPATIREILALPPHHVLHIVPTDPHPPPYLRLPLAIEWCRQTWGAGVWDDWDRQWQDVYPLKSLAAGARTLLEQSLALLPVVARFFLRTRFRVLQGRSIPDLFDLPSLAPAELQRIAGTLQSGTLQLSGIAPCKQLAVFRVLRETGKLKESELDAIMSRWLIKLGQNKKAEGVARARALGSP